MKNQKKKEKYFSFQSIIGKVSLALHNLVNDECSKEIICKFKYTAKELDLSNNSLV